MKRGCLFEASSFVYIFNYLSMIFLRVYSHFYSNVLLIFYSSLPCTKINDCNCGTTAFYTNSG